MHSKQSTSSISCSLDQIFTKVPLALKSALSCSVINGGTRPSEPCHPKESGVMTKMKCVIVFIACLSSASLLAGQQVVDSKDAAHLDAEREKRALQSLSRIVEKEITSAV